MSVVRLVRGASVVRGVHGRRFRRAPAPGLLAALVLSFIGEPAQAYDSKCRIGTRECKPGLETARASWNAADSEHFHLWNDTIRQRALRMPAHLTGKVQLKVPTVSGRTVTDLGGFSTTSVAPTPFAEANSLADRQYAIGEMAQLPDLSWALWDWAMGNEACPIAPGTPSDSCHDFASHMGALNSNHFLPQAKRFYEYYHALGMSQASSCASMRGALGVRYPEFVQACDQLAFTYESVAHHYLQDAWSMGHMWERWGGPNPGDFGGASDWRPRALLIALTSGLIHGAKGVVQSKLPSWLPAGSVDALDPMCAPLDPAKNNYGEPVWATLPPPTYEYAADHSLYTAVGDLYLDKLRSEYGVQYGRLIDCGAASLNQLAVQAGIGSLGSTPGSAPGSPNFNLECFDQRATNGTMYLGAGIDMVITPIQPIELPVIGTVTSDFHLRVELDGRLGSRSTPTPLIDRVPQVIRDFLPQNWKDILSKGPGELVADLVIPASVRHLVPMDASVAEAVIILSQYAGAVAVPEPLKTQFRNELAAFGPIFKARALNNPKGTNLASGGLVPLLGIGNNGAGAYQHDPPAEYLDPRGPYQARATGAAEGANAASRGTVLARAYHRAFATEWCASMTVADLEALRNNAGADCSICEEFAYRHVRIGTGPGSYDTAQEPACSFLASSPAIVYQPPAPDGTTLRQAAKDWCGCGEGGPRCRASFAGRVIDAATREPISGATAAFTSERASGSVQSGGDGNYVSDAIACGAFAAELSAPGYLPATVSFVLNEDGTTTQLVELAAIDEACLNQPSELLGGIRNGITGAPIAGATVELREGMDAPATSAPSASVTTDAAGVYDFAPTAGYYTISVSAPGFEPSGSRTVSVCGSGMGREIDLMPEEDVERPLSFVLTWAQPNDLDLHLLLPDGNDVSFGECSGSLDSSPFATLDVDHQLAEGPEAITVGQVTPGTYTLYVHNYSAQNEGGSSFIGSQAAITVYRNSQPAETLVVPTSGDGYFWDVLEFDAVGDVIDVRPLNALTNARRNPNGQGEYLDTCTPAP